MRRAAGIGSYHNARPRHLSLVQQTEPVQKVDKQIRFEKAVDRTLIGLVVGLLMMNIVNLTGKALGWW